MYFLGLSLNLPFFFSLFRFPLFFLIFRFSSNTISSFQPLAYFTLTPQTVCLLFLIEPSSFCPICCSLQTLPLSISLYLYISLSLYLTAAAIVSAISISFFLSLLFPIPQILIPGISTTNRQPLQSYFLYLSFYFLPISIPSHSHTHSLSLSDSPTPTPHSKARQLATTL
jgi:hypothetical protein